MSRALADLKIAHKLSAGFAVVCVLLAVVCGVGVVKLGKAQNTLEYVSTSAVPSLLTSRDTAQAMVQVRYDLAHLALVTEPSDIADAGKTLTESTAALQAAWKAYLDSDPYTTVAQRQAFIDPFQAFTADLPALRSLAEANDMIGFVKADEKALPAVTAAMAALVTITQVEQANVDALTARGESDYRTALGLLLGCAVLAVALAVLVAVVITRSINRPLARIVQVMAEVAEGRLGTRVGLVRKDEIGQLAASTDASLTTLSATMSDITAEARQLATSAAGLSSVSAQLSSGAAESAAQTQVVSAAAEEVTVSISTVAAAGEEMTAAIAQIATATADASAMAASAVATAGAAGQAISRLEVSSREIGDVVKLITSIAEQTNLLALNATIEAARAGEMGKGFAVVAGEVKELARQTAQATDEIIAKVSATQGDATAAASVMEIGGVIARIDEVQSTIAAAVEEQSATTSEMVRNVTEISSGSGQISANIASIAAGTEQNRGSAGHTASMSTDLTSSAARLAELTGRFTV
ncbi:methyl-accepting chemotaxis sensory transducer with TarH sensor [Quadrisphaera granulorum]|uniref:Methyl-accepting chemotaxis sensory transducer with TarH sensor n=1 Tax=Quadrisphaera granulorum TaxID=317664 RepID=A0A316AXM5_9ACTN|nr:methyl-accepting chemotaxis protein [Quadrisphaera granulorum]PWJ54957.1 methyl-accepting chemotaxis sensory transducer with TarH sensor [Quadrisphaera granulorum]SZE95903.1 methyl-accepting chemotaxis sensory transducer with TarH sensor [Quadrisphaera granulorum]